MTLHDKHGVGRATEVLGVYRIIGLQETRHSGQFALQAGYILFCSVESKGDGGGKMGQVGLDWLFARVSPEPPKYDRRSSSAEATEGDA